MAEQWANVRVKQDTADWLNAEIDRMVKAYTEGRQEVLPVTESSNPRHRGITVDAMIRHLLDFRQKHRERVRKARKTKKAKKG